VAIANVTVVDPSLPPRAGDDFPEVYPRLGAMESPLPPAARGAIFGTVRANLQKVQRAGLLVVAGTDTTVSGVLLGVSSQAELSLLVEDGLTTREALAAATNNAATTLGRQEVQGSVSPGKLADLVSSTPARSPISATSGRCTASSKAVSSTTPRPS
jgi:hypothetical protein